MFKNGGTSAFKIHIRSYILNAFPCADNSGFLENSFPENVHEQNRNKNKGINFDSNHVPQIEPIQFEDLLLIWKLFF